MPQVSQFYGIVIRMYYREHGPPHFHAIYGGDEAIFEIGTARMIHGTLTRRAERLATEWAAVHQRELAENWQRARDRQSLRHIEPLP